MKPGISLPPYLKAAQILMGLTVLFYILWLGQDILIPLVFAGMISILLNPLVWLLCKWKIPRVLGIIISLLLAMICIACVMYFFVSQISRFSHSFPEIKNRFIASFHDFESWVSAKFNIPEWRVSDWVDKKRKEGMDNGGDLIGRTVGTLGGFLASFFLMPVYTFMILYYKPLLLEFIARLFPKQHHVLVVEVLKETKGLIQRYLAGLLVEAVLVAALNATALMILSIKYAILIGVIGALLNAIPYIGGVIAVAIPMILALMTREPVYAIYVLIAYMIVQFIDNNYFVPRIVASKVKLNALISIIVVLVGNALWGIPGMFLAIPLTAIAKVIFDRIPPLAPMGFLLGDNLPDFTQQFFSVRRRTRQAATTNTSGK